MNVFSYLKESIESELGKKLNASQIQIIRGISNEYIEELKESLNNEAESLVSRIKANNIKDNK